ncbi:MAG: hypothetical protein EAZ07_03040 [Cytophagales bacterium]|nr:MAG: hypothetical protein EAZ07_03040 [Cytophagales bacterium]
MKIALDWTPNPTHCGIFTALSKSWFHKAGIDLRLISPQADNYTSTPSLRLKNGEAHLAIISPEELILDQLSGNNQFVPLRALLQQNVSSMAVLASSDIKRPAHLDGKKYALLGIPWEKEIITSMIKNDGGKGELEWVEAPKLDIYESLFEGKTDCAWIFKPIEGVEAKYKNLPLKTFNLEDYDVPYGPTTILASNKVTYDINKEEIEFTLSIIEAGYSLAHLEPSIAVDAIFNHPLNHYYKDYQLLNKCQIEILPYLNENGVWGRFNAQKMEHYKNWLSKHCINKELLKR